MSLDEPSRQAVLSAVAGRLLFFASRGKIPIPEAGAGCLLLTPGLQDAVALELNFRGPTPWSGPQWRASWEVGFAQPGTVAAGSRAGTAQDRPPLARPYLEAGSGHSRRAGARPARARFSVTSSHMALMAGLMLQGAGIGQTIGPLMVSAIVEASGSWDSANLIVAGLAGIGLLCAGLLRSRT